MSAKDLRESGTLPIGVEMDGQVHRDYVLRPRLVKDTLAALADPQAQADEGYRGVALIALQVEKLGSLTPEQITPALLLDMLDMDMGTLMQSASRLESRLATFRAGGEGSAPPAPGAGDGGGAVSGGA